MLMIANECYNLLMGGANRMRQISLDDQLYQAARQRAEKAGFSSVDEYVADLLVCDFQLGEENLDRFFTSEHLAAIDEAAADVARGNVHTMAQARQALAETRDAWLRDRAGEK